MMNKFETSNSRRMSITAYCRELKKLLDATTMPVANEVCKKLWTDYLRCGIYLDPEYIAADIACAEGHLTNPPPELPGEGVDLQPGSQCLLYRMGHKKALALEETGKLLSSKMSLQEMLQHKMNCLTILRVLSRYCDAFKEKV